MGLLTLPQCYTHISLDRTCPRVQDAVRNVNLVSHRTYAKRFAATIKAKKKKENGRDWRAAGL